MQCSAVRCNAMECNVYVYVYVYVYVFNISKFIDQCIIMYT